MRIVHLVNHCDHGHGNAHVAIDLACVQAALGHDVIYASRGGDYKNLLESSGVEHRTVIQDRNPFHLLGSLSTFQKLCRSFKPDIIHAHMMAGAALGFAASIVNRIPLVTTVHNSFDKHSILMRLGHKVVAVSEAERQLLSKRGYKTSQLAVVINGPNVSPRDHFLDSDRSFQYPDIFSPCVTTVCGLHGRKGVHDLIRGFAEAAQAFPDWHLYIVGDGPDKATLIQLTEDMNVSSKVTFVGSVPTSKSILEKSDIFVLASYADPCSLAVAEARAAGCAVIATSVGGTPEILNGGEAGKLVRPGEPSDIAKELKALMADPQTLATWRAKAKRGSEYFSVSRVVADYERVYASVM